jgi:hypothetical protein
MWEHFKVEHWLDNQIPRSRGGPGALQGCRKKPIGSGGGGERAAALSFQVPIAAPLGAVSKFPSGFGPAEPGLGAAHGSIGDALSSHCEKNLLFCLSWHLGFTMLEYYYLCSEISVPGYL